MNKLISVLLSADSASLLVGAVPLSHPPPLCDRLDWNDLPQLVDVHHRHHRPRMDHEGVDNVSLRVINYKLSYIIINTVILIEGFPLL